MRSGRTLAGRLGLTARSNGLAAPPFLRLATGATTIRLQRAAVVSAVAVRLRLTGRTGRGWPRAPSFS
jgi:hypothetical protein